MYYYWMKKDYLYYELSIELKRQWHETYNKEYLYLPSIRSQYDPLVLSLVNNQTYAHHMQGYQLGELSAYPIGCCSPLFSSLHFVVYNKIVHYIIRYHTQINLYIKSLMLNFFILLNHLIYSRNNYSVFWIKIFLSPSAFTLLESYQFWNHI